ncbi:hypothetical protein LCGC14_0591330 [marine sediment metagenome]|uniref:Uncharacterized protein n=1 Tax=marine sediment metagenome TaxID=412755 RepID=A0A0F9TZI8_9ZZZZ
MWRPKDWERHILLALDEIKEGKPVSNDEIDIYEAGANAMLEALKETGKHTDGLAPTLSINVLPEQKGWLVFIPEEV